MDWNFTAFTSRWVKLLWLVELRALNTLKLIETFSHDIKHIHIFIRIFQFMLISSFWHCIANKTRPILNNLNIYLQLSLWKRLQFVLCALEFAATEMEQYSIWHPKPKQKQIQNHQTSLETHPKIYLTFRGTFFIHSTNSRQKREVFNSWIFCEEHTCSLKLVILLLTNQISQSCYNYDDDTTWQGLRIFWVINIWNFMHVMLHAYIQFNI